MADKTDNAPDGQENARKPFNASLEWKECDPYKLDWDELNALKEYFESSLPGVQITFAKDYVSSENGARAVRATGRPAGLKSKSSDKSTVQSIQADKWKNRKDTRQYIRTLRALALYQLNIKYGITPEYVKTEFLRLSKDKSIPASERIRSLEALSKILGILRDNSSVQQVVLGDVDSDLRSFVRRKRLDSGVPEPETAPLSVDSGAELGLEK